MNVRPTRTLLKTTETCLNYEFLLEQQRNCRVENLTCKRSRGLMTLEGHAKKCVERYCEVANKTTHKVPTPCLDDHNFKEEELTSVGELSKVFSQHVLKRLYLARIGRPDILWSVKELARAVTKWTGACDKRLARLISYIHCTSDFKQYCHVGNNAQHCGLGYRHNRY